MKKFWDKYREIITYIIFGVLTTVVSWGSYTALIKLCDVSVFVGNLLSWIFAVTFAYVTNKLFVFESKSWKPNIIVREIVTFVASRGITGVIEIVCVPLLEKTGFDNIFYSILQRLDIQNGFLFTKGIYSKIVLSVIVVIVNYFLSKFVSFKKDKQQEAE